MIINLIKKYKRNIVVIMCLALIFNDISFVFSNNDFENRFFYDKKLCDEIEFDEIDEKNEEVKESLEQILPEQVDDKESEGNNVEEEFEEIGDEKEQDDIENNVGEDDKEQEDEGQVEIATESLINEIVEASISEIELVEETYDISFFNGSEQHTHFACGCEIFNLGNVDEAETCDIHKVSTKITYNPINQTNIKQMLADNTMFNYVLEEDVTIDTAYPVGKKYFNVCLNGHKLLFAKGLNFINLTNDGKITICDCMNHSGEIGFDSTKDATTDGTIFIINSGTISIYETDMVIMLDETTKKISLVNVKEIGNFYSDGLVIRDSAINKEVITPTEKVPTVTGISPLINVESSSNSSSVYMYNTEIKDNDIKGQPLISLGGKAKFLLDDLSIHNNEFEKSCIYVNNSVLSTISDVVLKENDGNDPVATTYQARGYSGFLSFYGDNVKTNIISKKDDVLFEKNTSIYKSLVSVYHGEISFFGNSIFKDNEIETNGGIFTVIGQSGEKNLRFYGNTNISNNTANGNTFLFQDFGGIYVASDANVYIKDNTSKGSYMMTFVDGKSTGGGFLIDGNITFYNNKALSTSDFGCIYLYSSNVVVNGSLVIDSYETAGYCGGIGLLYNSHLTGKNKNIILRNNKASYTGGIIITYITEDNYTQELSNIVFDNNMSTTDGYSYMDNIYAYKASSYKDFDIYIHDCDFIGSAGIYDGMSYKSLKIEKTSFKNIDKYSTSGWDSPIMQISTGVSLEFNDIIMDNVKTGAFVYSYYDYCPKIIISSMSIINSIKSTNVEDKTNKFAYFLYFYNDTYSNEADVTLSDINIENTRFSLPIINKDNSSNAKFKLTAKNLKFKNTYGDYGLFFLNNFAEGKAKFEDILIEDYESEDNENAYGVLHFENSVGTIKNLTARDSVENSPKPILGAYAGSKVNVSGQVSITNIIDEVALIETSGDGTILTFEDPLVMTGNKMSKNSPYKDFNAIGINVLSESIIKLLKGVNITSNIVENCGAVYISNSTLNVAGKVNIEKNTNKSVNVYFADANAKIEYLSGYDKIATSSRIYLTVKEEERLVFAYWNDKTIDSLNSGYYEIFNVDDNMAALGYKVYKLGTGDNVELHVGRDYEKLVYKKEENDEVIAVQYVAKNVKTVVDKVVYDKVPIDWQTWHGPSLSDDEVLVEWNIEEPHEVCLSATRYVVLKRLPKLNIKNHLNSKFITFKEKSRDICFNKTIKNIDTIKYESDTYEIYGWSYTPIYESFDSKEQAMADSRCIEGKIYDKEIDTDIYPMYKQLVAFIDYKNEDGTNLNMSKNSHLPKYVFTNMLATQSILAANKTGYNFLGWSGTDITDTPYKTTPILIYNITSIATRSYIAYFEKKPSSNVITGGGGSSSGGTLYTYNPSLQSDAKLIAKKPTNIPKYNSENVVWKYSPITSAWSLSVDKSSGSNDLLKGFVDIYSHDYITNKGKKDTYYFDGNGCMLTGWTKDDTGAMYYFNPIKDTNEGKMIIGWCEIYYGIWYFFGTEGKLVANGKTPDGYSVDIFGRYIVTK